MNARILLVRGFVASIDKSSDNIVVARLQVIGLDEAPKIAEKGARKSIRLVAGAWNVVK